MILKGMSNQRERSLDNLLGEIRELKGRMKGILPSYTASVKGLSQLPEEFDRRFWVSCVEVLLQKAKSDYENYQFQTEKANLFGKITETMVNFAWRTTGQQPMAHTSPLQARISISPSGKIEPTIFDDSYGQKGVTFVTISRFEAIARRLGDEIMKGKILPESESEIPKLIYDLALKLPESLPDRQT